MKRLIRRILLGFSLVPLLSFGSGYFSTSTGTPIGGTITGGTSGSILFINPTDTLAQDNANFSYSLTNHQLTLNVAPIITPFGTAGLIHNNSSGLLSSSLLINADVGAGAAIAYSKLALTGSIVNADLAAPITVANGGTGIASGTSGGIPYYSGTTTIASSGALTQHALVVGGGAGSTPTVVGSLGTTTTLLHGAAAGDPTFSAVNLANDVTGNLSVNNLNSGTSASSSTFWRGDGTWGTPAGTGTVTSIGLVGPGGSFSVTGSPVTTSGNITLSISGSSGGIPYFSTSTNLTSSSAQCQYCILVGGGVGNPPTNLGTGTDNTVLHGSTSSFPAFSQIVNADISSSAAIAGTKISFTKPTIQRFTSGSSATYTTPTSPAPIYLEVYAVGGGGGGAGSGTATSSSNGTGGGDTSFGTLAAHGGGGATFGSSGTGGAAGTIGTITVFTVIDNVAGAIGQGPGQQTTASTVGLPGGMGGSSWLGGAGASQNGGGGTAAATNSGSGGGGGGGQANASFDLGGGGGSGSYSRVYITSPAANYTYTVGAGGAGGSAGTAGNAGGAGAAGIIVVKEFYQ